MGTPPPASPLAVAGWRGPVQPLVSPSLSRSLSYLGIIAFNTFFNHKKSLETNKKNKGGEFWGAGNVDNYFPPYFTLLFPCLTNCFFVAVSWFPPKQTSETISQFQT